MRFTMIKWEEWWNINVSLVLFTTICFIENQWWGFTYMKKNCRINVQRKRLRIACPRCDDVDCGRYVGDWAWYWYLSSWPDWLNIWMSLANFRKRIAVALPMPVGLLRGIFVLSSFIQCRKKTHRVCWFIPNVNAIKRSILQFDPSIRSEKWLK